jgi:two-component system, NtrC family, response regulator GlrR
MRKATLLIVDDEPMLLELLQFAFEDCGLQVYTASGYDDAVSILASAKDIDAVLTDIKLQDRSGTDLLAYIRAHYGKIPVTLMSSHTIISRSQAQQLGAVDLLEKPLDLDYLDALIRILFNRN